jgi:hypothetical protein
MATPQSHLGGKGWMQFLLVSSGSRARNHFTFDSYLHVGGNRSGGHTSNRILVFSDLWPKAIHSATRQSLKGNCSMEGLCVDLELTDGALLGLQQ